MSDWVYIEHAETGGTARIPDDPEVVRVYEAKGWKTATPPDDSAPFVPSADGGQIVFDTEWVTLVHPETGATHQWPNNPEALEGAYEAGWQLPAPDESEKPVEPVKKTNSKATASTEPATDGTDIKE